MSIMTVCRMTGKEIFLPCAAPNCPGDCINMVLSENLTAKDTNVPTNADWLRSLDDEGLAKILLDGVSEKVCQNGCDGCDGDCDGHMLDWLRQPHEEVHT